VVAESALFHRADLAHGFLRLQIFVVRLKCHPAQAKLLEPVGKLQELGLGVQTCSVKLRCEPGMTQLRRLMRWFKIEEPRAANDSILRF
jgi:hypothetical protein